MFTPERCRHDMEVRYSRNAVLDFKYVYLVMHYYPPWHNHKKVVIINHVEKRLFTLNKIFVLTLNLPKSNQGVCESNQTFTTVLSHHAVNSFFNNYV